MFYFIWTVYSKLINSQSIVRILTVLNLSKKKSFGVFLPSHAMQTRPERHVNLNRSNRESNMHVFGFLRQVPFLFRDPLIPIYLISGIRPWYCIWVFNFMH